MRGGSRVGARVALIAMLLGVVATCAAASAAPQPARAAAPAFFGITPATNTNESELRRVAGGGARVVRFSLDWRSVQPRAHRPYSWVGPDHFVAAAARNGLDLRPNLGGSPSYAAWDMFRPPLDSASARNGWQAFVRAAVRRYGTTGPGSFWHAVRNCLPGNICDPDLPVRPIRTWQVWNEPNMKLFWKPQPNVAEYATLLRLTEGAIHGVAPSAQVVTGGLTPGGGRYGPPGTEFLEDLYAVPGAAGLFDSVALHPYAEHPAEVIDNVETIRAVMNQHGDTGGGIAITEVGWATGGPPDSHLVVSPEEQAERLGVVMDTLSKRRSRYGVQAVMPYTDHDFAYDGSTCEWCPYAGLMTSDGRAKPAWRRYSEIALANGGAPPRLVSTVTSSSKAFSRLRGRKRGTGARTTVTVERYSDGSAIVEMANDDLRLNRGRWDVASCLRFHSGSRPGGDDHNLCDRQRLRIKSRGKSIPPGDKLLSLDADELARDPYATRPRVVGYVQARKRVNGKWRNRLTSLRKGASGIPLR